MYEVEHELPRLGHCWWRCAGSFDECVKSKLDLPDVSSLTPRIKLLREMERLALVAADGLHELKQKLRTYRSGDLWVPTGGIKKENLQIPPVNTILLVGFSGSGKSALVNLLYSVLGRSGLIPFAKTSTGGCSNFTTMCLEEHNVLRSMHSGFCVYDSRGFDYDKLDESLEELSRWISEGIHHNQLCLRSGDDFSAEEETENSEMRLSCKFLKRKVNSAIVVANVAEIYRAFKAGNLKPLKATKELFCCPALRKCNESPLLILTHGDLLSTEERIDGRLKICQCLGISETWAVYDIPCLTEYGILVEEADPVTAYALVEAVYRTLLISDRGHVPKKNLQEWAALILSSFFYFLGVFFSFVAHLCSEFGNRNNLKL